MKTAVVTGGASGIGYGIAQMLEADGYRVVVRGRHDEQAVREAMKMLPHGVYAVSYTHLDVYKRQVLRSVLFLYPRGDISKKPCCHLPAGPFYGYAYLLGEGKISHGRRVSGGRSGFCHTGGETRVLCDYGRTALLWRMWRDADRP